MSRQPTSNIYVLGLPLGMSISTSICPGEKIPEVQNEFINFENFRVQEARRPDHIWPSWLAIPLCTRITLEAALLYELL